MAQEIVKQPNLQENSSDTVKHSESKHSESSGSKTQSFRESSSKQYKRPKINTMLENSNQKLGITKSNEILVEQDGEYALTSADGKNQNEKRLATERNKDRPEAEQEIDKKRSQVEGIVINQSFLNTVTEGRSNIDFMDILSLDKTQLDGSMLTG